MQRSRACGGANNVAEKDEKQVVATGSKILNRAEVNNQDFQAILYIEHV
jgi:hypothetical protein